MFNNDNWTLIDYIDENIEMMYIYIYYRCQEISLNIPQEIITNDNYEIIKYDYDAYINDLFKSFLSYKDIENQAVKDLVRSVVFINGDKICRSVIYETLVEIMNKYLLTQKEKYTILMLVSQGVFGIPYHYLATQNSNYHLGELGNIDKKNNNSKLLIYIIINSKKIKIILKKQLRLFSINDGEDTTIKKYNFIITARPKKKTLSCKIVEMD
jgi:hypothetical protein